MIKVNDIVRFLNEVGGGRVVKMNGNIAHVEDQDGFERPVLTRELVVVDSVAAPAAQRTYDKPLSVKSKLVEPDKPAPKPQPQPEPVLEVDGGDTLNVMLAFEPREIKHITTTTFFAVLVNDSNYFLHYAYLTRGDENKQWRTRASGVLEPNMQLQIDEIGFDDLNLMTHVAVQYFAIKQDKAFQLKNPALVTHRLDVTKFYKLHSFRPNEYFDTPVLALEITRNDLPAKLLRIDASALENAMRDKRRDKAPQHPSKAHRDTAKQHDEIIVKDLHIAALLDTTAGMDHSDMLAYQLDVFRQVMRDNHRRQGQKIVFIHGKGEGVLRRAIIDELRRKWPACEVQDASFQEYGFGATQVTIHH